MTQALATLAETIGRASLKNADEIRCAEPELTVEGILDPVEELELGSRQREIVEILRNGGDGCITTSQVASQMEGYDTANAHMALRALQNKRVIEEVPTKKPIHWRPAQQYRATADPYRRPNQWRD